MGYFFDRYDEIVGDDDYWGGTYTPDQIATFERLGLPRDGLEPVSEEVLVRYREALELVDAVRTITWRTQQVIDREEWDWGLDYEVVNGNGTFPTKDGSTVWSTTSTLYGECLNHAGSNNDNGWQITGLAHAVFNGHIEI